MSDKPAPVSRRSIASFSSDDEIPVPTPQQLAAVKSVGEGLGFRSEKAAASEALEPMVTARARQAKFTDAIHVRSRPEDRQRFEDFTYRNRLSKGDAMTRLLDFAEAEERRRSASEG